MIFLTELSCKGNPYKSTLFLCYKKIIRSSRTGLPSGNIYFSNVNESFPFTYVCLCHLSPTRFYRTALWVILGVLYETGATYCTST